MNLKYLTVDNKFGICYFLFFFGSGTYLDILLNGSGFDSDKYQCFDK